MQTKVKKITALLSSLLLSFQYAFTAFATNNVSIDDEKFKSMSVDGVPSLIIGTVIWGLRIIGVVVLMVGIYRFTSARKSGEADDMNGAMMKLIIGVCFISFAAILKAINIIN